MVLQQRDFLKCEIKIMNSLNSRSFILFTDNELS